MNKYKQFILDIIINRGRFSIPDDEYKEEHHVIPKCMGGSDDEENLVHLYAREHIIAHKLLTEIYPNHNGLWDAFWRMCNCKKFDDFITPEEYELARIKHGKAQSERMKEYWENNQEAREAQSERMKGHEVTEKTRESISKALSKPVEAINPESGQRALYFKSTKSAGRAGFNQGHVCECCNGKQKTHKGYYWRYVKEVSDNDSDN